MATHTELPTSTANWHWKNKNVSKWAYSWFERELPTLSVSGDAGEVKVKSVTEVDGDVELGQRKSKLITIFDCKVILEWTGTASDGTEVNGKLTVPEVSHEVTVDKLSDYEYQWSLDTESSKPVTDLYTLARSKLPAALEAKFAEFPVALVDTHGKDLTVVGSNQPSRTSTPANSATSSSVSGGAKSTDKKPEATKKKASVNTKKVTAEASFMASADDLFSILTDERRIPQWSRAPAQSKPEAGAEYALFGGGVKGKYVSLTPGKEVVQTWALSSPTWPSGHIATLTTTFDQGSDSTKLVLSLEGVPTGMEDEIKTNLEGYYIHGLKSIGLGSVL